MQIKPDEITSILKNRIEGLDADSADLTEVGTVLSVASLSCAQDGKPAEAKLMPKRGRGF